MPLRVQVFPRGARNPAFQVGYTSISFVRPAASNFDFSPPPSAKVKTATLAPRGWSGRAPLVPQKAATAPPRLLGKDWLTVAVLPASALSEISGGSGSAAGLAGSAARSAASGPGGSAAGRSGPQVSAH